jgi:peptide/nickel transport system substrate-binding protein
VLAPIALMLALSGCAPASQAPSAPAASGTPGTSGAPTTAPSASPAVEGGTMTVRIAGAPDTLDIGVFLNPSASQVSTAAYDRLLATDANNQLIPYLAESWTETLTSIEFKIREGATCADGTPVTPTVVANSLKRLTDPATVSPRAGRLFGPPPYTVASDDAAGTVTFGIETPFNELAWGFTSPWSGIICPAGLADPEALKEQTFGSGPFVIESTVPGDSITFKARPEWAWGPNGITASDPGFPDTLVYKVVPNDTTAANLLTTGELDIAFVGGPDVPRLLSDASLQNFVSHSFYSHPLTMNETEGHITADPVIREAIVTALDPNAWNEVAHAGLGLVSPSFLSPDADCFDGSTESLLPTYDPARAKAILIEHGYTEGSGGLLEKDGQPLNLRVLGSATYQSSGMEYIGEQLSAVGFTVDLQNVDHPVVVTETVAGNFDVTVSFLPSHTPQPGIYIRLMSGPVPPDGTNNNRSALDPAITDAVNLALSSSPEERCAHWATVQRLMLEGHHILPMAAPARYWFSRGIALTPINADWIDPFFIRQ